MIECQQQVLYINSNFFSWPPDPVKIHQVAVKIPVCLKRMRAKSEIVLMVDHAFGIGEDHHLSVDGRTAKGY
ncbi:hypothetical protein D9M71_799160 [compost metagenome]